MLPQSLLLLLAATSASLAAPTPSTKAQRDLTPSLKVPASSLQQPSTLSPDLALKEVVLGLGHQNYTCSSSSTLSAMGATAALYDIHAALTSSALLASRLPSIALSQSGLQLDRQPDAANKALDDADFTRQLQVASAGGVQQLGVHFFAADTPPQFELFAAEPPARLVAKKLAGAAAPADSCAGPDGAGAVDWLLLADSGEGRSFGGVSHVYRVVTAGGKPPADCSGMDAGSVVRVPYAAEYWFYGPDEDDDD